MTRAVKCLLVAATIGFVTACTGNPGDGIATAGGSTSGPAGGPTEVDVATAMRQYQQCLRDHGVALPDANGATTSPAAETDTRVLQAALEACRSQAVGEDLGGDQAAELIARRLTAQCMRSNGYPRWPDPIPGSGTIILPRDINPESPEVKATLARCARQFDTTTTAPPHS